MMRAKTRRVVVTGVGAVTTLGHSVRETFSALVTEQSGAAPIRQFDAAGWPVRIACEVTGFELEESHQNQSTSLPRSLQFALQSAKEAMSMSGLNPDPQRFGVAAGAGIGAIAPKDILALMRDYPLHEGFAESFEHLNSRVAHELLLYNHPTMLATTLARRFGAQAGVKTMTTACAASAQAIGEAYEDIRDGRADAYLCGGADCLSGIILMLGFAMLGVLATPSDESMKAAKGAARPFDKSRRGFVVGEGAAFLVLEERESALERGAEVIGELVGYGQSENAYRITDLPADGRGATTAMRQAIAQAGVDTKEVSAINAHGTGTQQNDLVEAQAIGGLFPHRPLITANKPAVGHLIAAAGAVEAAISVCMLKYQKTPAILNLTETDCGDLNFVVGASVDSPLSYVMSNSFGFGGTNASLLFRRAI